VEPVFKPPFDIIWKLAQEARKYKPSHKKEAAEDFSTACPIALLDQDSKHLIADIIPIIKPKRRKRNIKK
jgi:hypothetical protein